MSQISFGSTFRIPVTQAGVNNAKKEKLRVLTESYENGLIGKSKTGYARVSIPDCKDDEFVSKLKGIGYKVFQKFEGENISKEKLDYFIKQKLDARDYNQKGKKMKKMSREMREDRRYDRSVDAPKNKKNSQNAELTDDIIDIKYDGDIKSSKEKEMKTSTLNRIRNSADYIRIKDEYGEEAAEQIFFGRR